MEYTNEQMEAAMNKVEFTVSRRENGTSRAQNLLAFAAKHGLTLEQISIENHKAYDWKGGNNDLSVPVKFVVKTEIGSYSGKNGYTSEKWWAVADVRNTNAAQTVV